MGCVVVSDGWGLKKDSDTNLVWPSHCVPCDANLAIQDVVGVMGCRRWVVHHPLSLSLSSSLVAVVVVVVVW